MDHVADPWVPFHVALAMVAKGIGSDVLAWDELPRLLREGHVRAIAECTDLDEVSGEPLRSYDTTLPKEWWSKSGRFHRSAIDARLYLMVDKYECYEDNGYCFYRKHAYDRVRIFKPDLEKHVAEPTQVEAAAVKNTARQMAEQAQTGSSRRGPRPSVSERVKAEMRQVSLAELRTMKMEEMKARFNASFDTCTRARTAVLSEFSED